MRKRIISSNFSLFLVVFFFAMAMSFFSPSTSLAYTGTWQRLSDRTSISDSPVVCAADGPCNISSPCPSGTCEHSGNMRFIHECEYSKQCTSSGCGTWTWDAAQYECLEDGGGGGGFGGGNTTPGDDEYPVDGRWSGDCSVISGWVGDYGWRAPMGMRPGEHIELNVKIYSGPRESGGVLLGSIMTSGHYTTGEDEYKRRFSFPTPESVKDGIEHSIYVYGVDPDDGYLWVIPKNHGSVFPYQKLTCGGTPIPPPTGGVRGVLQSAVCDANGYITVRGWACDPNVPSATIPVHFYADALRTGHLIGHVRADIDQNQQSIRDLCGGTSNHRFTNKQLLQPVTNVIGPVASQWRDGNQHSLFSIGLGVNRANDALLSNMNPTSNLFTCPRPPACVPSCAGSGQVCRGVPFSDGCGGACWGTRHCAPPPSVPILTFTVRETANPGNTASNGGNINIPNNTPATLLWTSTNAVSCNAVLGGGNTAWNSGGAISNTGVSTGNLTSGIYRYSLQCVNSIGDSIVQTVFVNVGPPIGNPTITYACNPAGDSVTFSWASVPTATHYPLRVNDMVDPWGPGPGQGCAFSTSPNDTCLDNIAGLSYTRPTVPGHDYQAWIHACRPGDCSAGAVTIPFPFRCLPPPPTVSLDLNPPVINIHPSAPQSSTLTWNSSGQVTSCSAVSGPGFNTGGAPSGSQSVRPAAVGVYPYTVSCTGPGGTAQDSKNLTVQRICTPDPTCGGTIANICTDRRCVDACGNSYDGTKDCRGFFQEVNP